MKVGLFFGSFNPIHTGHLFIANHMACHTELDEVWLVVSPQNPFKKKSSLLPEYDRLHLVNLAIEGNDKLKASSIEFNLPQPSYTIDTLIYLEEKFPTYEFSLIMGADNLPTLHKWKNSDILINNYDIFVYQRPGTAVQMSDYPKNIQLQETPQILLSASYIRKQLKEKNSIKYLVPESVEQYILEMAWYN